MQLAAAVLPAAAAGQDGSVGRHRRAAALTAHQHHGHGPAQHHHHGRPAAGHQGILSSFLGRHGASVRQATTRGTVAASAAAVATVTATAVASAAQQQQQQQRAPDLGYPRSLLKDFVLLQQIGKGGNGVVALAQRRDELEAEGTAARKFAVKSLPKVLKDGSELKRTNHLQAVQREITVLKRLRGSLNVVSLEAVYEDDTHVHLVMEHCAGGELTSAIGERHHSERAVASYMRAVLRTLAQCHAHHILHRDIKPGNFMLLSGDERAPIRAIDFGLAMPYDPEELPCTNLGLEGTPWFMAPEVLSSKVLPASDLWSAGVMCFQLLTGRMPFDDKLNPGNPSINAIWRSILFDEVDFTKSWWRGISPEAKDFVRLLLQRDPDKRPTAKEALKHAWLAGDSSDRSSGRKLQRSVVARIQRFAGSSVFKRSVLQMIAMELQRHPECHLNSHGSADWSSAASLAAAAASAGATCNPVPASLTQLFASLDFDPQTDDVPTTEVALALRRLGFRLTDDETERLLEQLDPAGSGRVSRAALAASQMDWRQLQAQDQRRWVDVARRVFSALDADADGVLKVRELTEHVLRVLPGDEGEMAELVRQAVEEAAAAEASAQHQGDEEHDDEGHDEARRQQHQQLLRADVDALLQATDLTAGGMPGAAASASAAAADMGMDFAGFLRLLKASSVDSLDMYDDRAALGASLHSVDRLNSVLQRSGTATSALASLSGSRHGTRHGGAASSLGLAAGSVDSSHGGMLAGGSVHGGGGAARRSVDAGPEGVKNALYGRESLWRFEVGGEGVEAAAGSRAGVLVSAPVPIAGKQQAAAAAAAPAWRFDVAGAGSGVAAAAPAAPVWRFDVAGPSAPVAAAAAGGRPAALGGDAVAVQGVAARAAGGAGGGAVPAGPWRFDVGETRAAAAAAAAVAPDHHHGLFAADAASPGGQGGDGFSSLSSSHEDEGLALAALVLQTPPSAGAGAEHNGAGGGRGPLGGWYDARQHGSKLYAASALGRRGPPGALPPVNE